MKAACIFKVSRTIELKSGKMCRLSMDLYKIVVHGVEHQVLEQYRLSWIFFDEAIPHFRVLMDNHQPIGLHLHINDGPQIPVKATTIEEAESIFFETIKNHFGEEIEV